MYRVWDETTSESKLTIFVTRCAVVCSWLILSASELFARCVMCKLAVSSSDDNVTMVSSLNLGILVLLIPPVLIFSALLIVAFRYAKLFDHNQHSPEESP